MISFTTNFGLLMLIIASVINKKIDTTITKKDAIKSV